MMPFKNRFYAFHGMLRLDLKIDRFCAVSHYCGCGFVLVSPEDVLEPLKIIILGRDLKKHLAIQH